MWEPIWRAFVLSFALWASAATAHAQEVCEETIARYSVRRDGPDGFRVEAQFNQPVSRLDLFHHSPPARPEGQAASIRNLRAFSARRREVAINYVGEGGWEVPGPDPAWRITYRISADHDAVDWTMGAPGKDEVATRFDRTFYFAAHAFFLADFDWPECKIEIAFDLPSGWFVTAPWSMRGNLAWTYGVQNFERNAFAMGLDAPRRAYTGGVDLEWLSDSRARSVEPRVLELMNAIPVAYTAFWGRAPSQRLTAFFLLDENPDGGAFENSFTLVLPDPLAAIDQVSWSHTLGHELMHLWFGSGGVRGDAGGELSWFNEGFADYLAIKLMRSAGLISEDLMAQRVANIIRRYELGKEASPDIGLVAAGADKRRNWQLIYGGGALVALLLDAELSRQHPERFRDMMRSLAPTSGSAFDLNSLTSQMNESTAGLAGQTLAWVEARPGADEIRARLARSGVEVSFYGPDEVYVGFGPCPDLSCAPAFLAGPSRSPSN